MGHLMEQEQWLGAILGLNCLLQVLVLVLILM